MNYIDQVDIRPSRQPANAHCADCRLQFGGQRKEAREHSAITGHTVLYDVTERTTYTPRAVR